MVYSTSKEYLSIRISSNRQEFPTKKFEYFEKDIILSVVMTVQPYRTLEECFCMS